MPFTEERFLSRHSTIKSKLVECCSDLFHLYTGSLELCRSDYWVLGHHSYPGPSPLIAQLATCRKSPGCSKLLPFNNYGGHCGLGNLQCSRKFSSAWQAIPSTSWLGFWLWYALPAGKPDIDRCMPFQIMCNRLNLPQFDSNQGVETFQRWSREMGGTWAKFKASEQRVWILWNFHVYFVIMG